MLNELVRILREGRRFVITTHKHPDGDGLGAMFALGRSLRIAGKEAVLLSEEPLTPPFDRMRGAETVLQNYTPNGEPVTLILLDCADFDRPGKVVESFKGDAEVVNIDHHFTNTFFGRYNWVEPECSSTGELIYRLLQHAGFPIDREIAENLFIAIQSDTGSFRYENATAAAFSTAAALVGTYGVRPSRCARLILDEYPCARLYLLRSALGTLETHLKGKIAMVTVSLDMYREAHASTSDSDTFVDYPRFLSGVEIGVLVRQTAEDAYKFSLRSNDFADVAALAKQFGGGGHKRAAGFDAQGRLADIKLLFLGAAAEMLEAHAA